MHPGRVLPLSGGRRPDIGIAPRFAFLVLTLGPISVDVAWTPFLSLSVLSVVVSVMPVASCVAACVAACARLLARRCVGSYPACGYAVRTVHVLACLHEARRGILRKKVPPGGPLLRAVGEVAPKFSSHPSRFGRNFVGITFL